MQKPICVDLFSSLFKHFLLCIYWHILFIYFFFGQGEFSKQAKISYFVDFDWEKHIEMVWVVHIQGLRHAKSNGAGFESLWISGYWKIKISGKTISHKMGLKTFTMHWEKCIEMLLESHSTSTPHFIRVCLSLPVKNQENPK